MKPQGPQQGLVDLGRIPPLWEAASLKPRRHVRTHADRLPYSASLGGGLIEAAAGSTRPTSAPSYSASLGGGLIEAAGPRRRGSTPARCIPPLWEAASLKPPGPGQGLGDVDGIPPLWEAASLKQFGAEDPLAGPTVFRLFGRRPH